MKCFQRGWRKLSDNIAGFAIVAMADSVSSFNVAIAVLILSMVVSVASSTGEKLQDH